MDQNQKTVLMTGSTGSFGRFLALELLKDKTVNLILLVRASSTYEARNRVSEIISSGSNRVEVYKSDILESFLGLSEQEYTELCNKTTHIIHSAASTRFNLPLDKARLSNVVNTEHMISFAENCPNLIRFGFLSTALVAGKRSGVVEEEDFEHNEGFNNSYQQTKYEAELLVRASAKMFPVVIFRPPFIISPDSPSDSKGGQVNFLSILISLVVKGHLSCVPGSEENKMDLVNARDAAKIIAELLLKEKLSHTTYHITNGFKALDIKTFRRMIEEKTGRHIPIEYCGNIESFTRRVSEISKKKPEVLNIYKKAESFLLEPAYPKIFDNKNTLSEMGISQLGENPLDTLKIVFKDDLWNLSE